MLLPSRDRDDIETFHILKPACRERGTNLKSRGVTSFIRYIMAPLFRSILWFQRVHLHGVARANADLKATWVVTRLVTLFSVLLDSRHEHGSNSWWMLGQRRRRCTNIHPELDPCSCYKLISGLFVSLVNHQRERNSRASLIYSMPMYINQSMIRVHSPTREYMYASYLMIQLVLSVTSYNTQLDTHNTIYLYQRLMSLYICQWKSHCNESSKWKMFLFSYHM